MFSAIFSDFIKIWSYCDVSIPSEQECWQQILKSSCQIKLVFLFLFLSFSFVRILLVIFFFTHVIILLLLLLLFLLLLWLLIIHIIYRLICLLFFNLWLFKIHLILLKQSLFEFFNFILHSFLSSCPKNWFKLLVVEFQRNIKIHSLKERYNDWVFMQ